MVDLGQKGGRKFTFLFFYTPLKIKKPTFSHWLIQKHCVFFIYLFKA